MAKRGLWKMIAIAATFGLALALTGCGGNGGGGGGQVTLGETLKVSGPVYLFDWDNLRSVRFRGDREVISWPQDGTGEIVGGQLSFEIGRLLPENMWSLYGIWFFEGVDVSPSGAIGALLELETRDRNWGRLGRGNYNIRISGNNQIESWDEVRFVFVDREVTISRDVFVDSDEYDGAGWTTTTNAFSITLQEGWNAVRFVGSGTVNMDTDVGTFTRTISLGNPNVRWHMFEYDDFSADLEPLGETPARQGRGWLPPSRAHR